MKTFPMFLKVAGHRIVIVGGGEQAAQKARLVLKTEADLLLISPTLDAELSALVDSGRAVHRTDASGNVFDDVALVFVATGCKGADASWHALAKAAGTIVNVVDYPDLCDAITPSIVDRDPVVVAIGTEGTAPVLGRKLKSRIEQMLHPRLGAFAALAGRLRREVARTVPVAQRRSFWHWVFDGAPWNSFSIGNEREAAMLVKAALLEDVCHQTSGRLTIVYGATAPDLVTLGIAERLQAADTVYVEDAVPSAVLELARRDARRVTVRGTHPKMPESSLRLAANEAGDANSVVYVSTRHSMRPVWLPSGVIEEHLSCAVANAPSDLIRRSI